MRRRGLTRVDSEDNLAEVKGLVKREFRRVKELYAHGYIEVLKRVMRLPDNKLAQALEDAEDDVRALQLFVALNAQAMQSIVKKLERRLQVEGFDGSAQSSPYYHQTPTSSQSTPIAIHDDPVLKELRGEIAKAVHKMNLRTPQHVEPKYKLYWQRWWILSIFSLLSLFNNVVCFTFAPISSASKLYYGTDVNLGHLVAFFFLAYIIFSFPSSRFVEKYGLRSGILVGAWLQVLGNSIRCLGHRVISDAEFPCVLAGQLVASLAQPFFVNPPPLIAATWFGKTERTLATTVAVNSNQFGIAVAYFLAPTMVHAPMDIPAYLDVLTITSLVLAAAATIYFPSGPPTAPSRSKEVAAAAAASEGGRLDEDDDNNWGIRMWQQCIGLFFAEGFARTVLVFGTAEATINSYSTFLNSLLVPRGFSKQFISYMGILFITTCMIASGPLGYLVDMTRQYKLAILLCLIGLVLSLTWISYADSYLSVTLAIAMTGIFVGPVQPVVMELAAQITYPAPEELMATVQQVAGNCISVLMFLVIDAIHNPEYSMMGIMLCVLVTVGVFVPFQGKLERDFADAEGERDLTRSSRVESWKEKYLRKYLPSRTYREFKESPSPLKGGLGGKRGKSGAKSYGSLLDVPMKPRQSGSSSDVELGSGTLKPAN